MSDTNPLTLADALSEYTDDEIVDHPDFFNIAGILKMMDETVNDEPFENYIERYANVNGDAVSAIAVHRALYALRAIPRSVITGLAASWLEGFIIGASYVRNGTERPKGWIEQ